MTDFKMAVWMEGWSQDDHDAYEAAWTAATPRQAAVFLKIDLEAWCAA